MAVTVLRRAGEQRAHVRSQRGPRRQAKDEDANQVGRARTVLRVGHGVADDALQEDLEHRSRLLVDEAGDALDAAAAREAADRRFGDALDVVAQHLAVALGAALAQALAALAPSRHCGWSCEPTQKFFSLFFFPGFKGYTGIRVRAIKRTFGHG